MQIYRGNFKFNTNLALVNQDENRKISHIKTKQDRF